MKKTVQDNPAMFTFDRLFEEIIGRKLGNDVVVSQANEENTATSLIDTWFDHEDQMNASKASDEDKQAWNRYMFSLFYEDAVNLILNSQQYIDEGFLHLHKRRLLLFYQGNDTFMSNAIVDYLALQAEMRDVAAADNYWKLFTYQDRYLAISGKDETAGLPMFSCFGTGEDVSIVLNNNKKCIKFLLASFFPEYQHAGTCYTSISDGVQALKVRKFSSIYYERCGNGSIVTEDTDFCAEVNTGYQKLLGKNYPDVAQATTDTNICYQSERPADEQDRPSDGQDQPSDEGESNDPLYNKAKENLLPLIYFYVSLYLSEGAKNFVEASQPTGDNYLHVVRNEQRGKIPFVKTRLPAYMQGIHANPFWLSQHRSTASNMNLHRARLLLYSWFCEYISPDAASLGGGTVDSADPERKKLQSYFAQSDIHTFGDRNCFDCHKRTQPLANYFGQLSFGAPYHDALEFLRHPYHQRLLEKNNSFDRPAGYYDIFAKDFFATGQGRGMEALAELLQEHPRVQQCIVESTWNSIFGSHNQLHSTEIDTAIKKFAEDNFSYKKLLKHLLLSKKARTYFLDGQEALTEIIVSEQTNCEEAKRDKNNNLHGKTAQDIFSKTCNACHANGSSQPNYSFLSNNDSGGEFIETAAEEVYKEVYRRVSLDGADEDSMPQTGYNTQDGFPAAYKQKDLLLCYLRDKAVNKGYTLEELDSDDEESSDSVSDKMNEPVSNNHQGETSQ